MNTLHNYRISDYLACHTGGVCSVPCEFALKEEVVFSFMKTTIKKRPGCICYAVCCLCAALKHRHQGTRQQERSMYKTDDA